MYPIEVVKMVIMAKVNWKMEMETHSLWARIYCGKLKNTYPLEFPIFMENIIFIKLLWECWWPGRLIQKAFIKIVAKEGFKARLPFSYNKEVWSEKKKANARHLELWYGLVSSHMKLNQKIMLSKTPKAVVLPSDHHYPFITSLIILG